MKLSSCDLWVVVKVILLEPNLFKNVSKWVTFFWQTQIQSVEYGLNDAYRETTSTKK